MAIEIREAIPVIYSAKVLEDLDNALVFGHVATKEFEGEAKKGNRVIVTGIADPTVNSYTGASITYEDLIDGSIQIDITEQDYVAYQIDDIDKFQSNVDYMNKFAKKAAQALKENVDTTLAALYSESAHGGAWITDADVDTSTCTSVITELHTALAMANVPEGQMWVIVPWWYVDKLRLVGIYRGIEEKGGVYNNFITHELGFDIYASNNVSGSKGSNEYIMAGSYDAIAYCSQIEESQIFPQLEDYFKAAARTLHVWGYKVIKPKELFYADVTYTAESNV